ncbi:MAG: hypothetical protein QNK05_16095 [Myxococcota bacterium]|nr:hypothetical protein [Myxococcota bacterium]
MSRRRMPGRTWLACGVLLGALASVACETPPPVVNVEAPPCDCQCSFQATAPQVGKGCWVSGDKLVCPLVRRTLELEPAYPSEDPRCERQEDGSLRCEVHSGD